MTSPRSVRRPLTGGLGLAIALLVVQGLVFLGLGVAEWVSTSSPRVVMGITTGAFLAGYGLLLLALARGLYVRMGLARGIAVGTQLLHVPVAWSFHGGATTWVTVVGIGVSLVTATLLVLPSTTAALDGGDD